MASERTRPLPLDESAELTGEWWLPDDVERTAFGRLIYSPHEGLTLHLASGADIVTTQRPAAWVNGLTVHGRRVTLRNCIARSWSLNIPGGIETRAYAEQAFIGMHAASERTLSMLRLTARMSSLNEWLGVSGLTVTPSAREHPQAAAYVQPGNVELLSIGGSRLTASFELTGSAEPRGNPYEVNLQQRSWLGITPRHARRFFELWALLQQFNEFLSFASGVDCPILEVMGTARVRGSTFGPGHAFTSIEPVWVLYARPDSVETTQVSERMLFRHADVVGRNNLPLLRWFRRAALRAVARVYLSGLPTRALDPESRFLTSMQALEGYERYKRPRGRRNLERRVNDLVGLIPARVQAHVPQHFAELAAVTRDYFSHRIPQLEHGAATGDRLFPLMIATKGLFDLVLMRELGFTQTQIADWTLSQNQRLVAQMQRGFLSL